eukprot:767179-Hanusia_phi.AAC.3
MRDAAAHQDPMEVDGDGTADGMCDTSMDTEVCIPSDPGADMDVDKDNNAGPAPLLAAQAACFTALAAFYIALEIASYGGLANNANAVLRGLESVAVDATTVLFVLAGYLDSRARHGDPSLTAARILYDVNARPYPHILLANLACTPVGMAAAGAWGNPMAWATNLGSALYLSPFLEFTQSAPYRLFNRPTSILMTYLLCRSLHLPVAASVSRAVDFFPQWHEGINMANVILQTAVSCIVTATHLRGDHFYYSFRFLLPRLSEYTFGCVCHTYLAARADGIAFRRVAAWLAARWRWIALLHVILWAAHLGVPAEEDPPVCARAAQGAPCMTHFDAVISRAVPITLVMLYSLPTLRDSTGAVAVVAGMLPAALLAVVYQFPVACAFRAAMQAVGWQRVATVVAISSAVAGWHLTLLLDTLLTPRFTTVIDAGLDRLQAALGWTAA